jgi:hypothetical protein
MVPWESLGDLVRDPLRSRVSRHAKRQPNSSSMPYDDKTIEDPERDRWKDKKVDRRDAVGMVAQKRAPALRRPWRAMVSRWWPVPTAGRPPAPLSLHGVCGRHSPDQLWNGVDDSRRRGSREATGGLRPTPVPSGMWLEFGVARSPVT